MKPTPNGIFMRFSLETVLLPALLVALPATSAGQSTGVRGGLNISSVAGTDAADTESRKGLSFSGFYNLPLPGIFGAQIGVGFTQRGFTKTVRGVTTQGRRARTDSVVVETEATVGYAEVPLLLTLSPFGGLGFNLSTGLVLGFMTGCNVTFSDDSVSHAFSCHEPRVDLKPNGFDVSATVGAGMELGLTGNASLLLDVFYSFGLTKVERTGVDDDIKYRTLSILVGASFAVNR